MSVLSPPPPSRPTSAARGALGLAALCFLAAFALGYSGAAPGLGATLDIMTIAFLIAAGVLYVMRR